MITDLRLQHFRSYTDSSFEFAPGVNIIVGPNASGKTNLLEALLVLGRGVSYRAKDSRELVEFEQDWLRIDSHDNLNSTRTVKIHAQPVYEKIYGINNKTYKRLPLQYNTPIVLFEPNHLRLLHGGPDQRRDYLDDFLERIQPGIGQIRRQYKRALSQRNQLLKQIPTSYSQVFPWDVRLSQLAGQLVRARYELIDRINEELPRIYKDLSQKNTQVELMYLGKWDPPVYEAGLLKKLESHFNEDVARGFTAYGPHREEFQARFDGRDASEVASRGEIRTAILALKIIETSILEAAREQAPLLLLDDVFSELDGSRRHSLTQFVRPYQTIITTTDADLAVKEFAQDCSVIAL